MTDDPRTTEQCRYMASAYPDLDASDTCTGIHAHTQPVFNLAFALAMKFQDTPTPTDEQIAWFLNDADAVMRHFPASPLAWSVEHDDESKRIPGVDFYLRINGLQFVIPDAEFEPATPDLRSEYLAETDLTEEELADDRPPH